jgi:hypothetical protein
LVSEIDVGVTRAGYLFTGNVESYVIENAITTCISLCKEFSFGTELLFGFIATAIICLDYTHYISV